MTYSLAVRNGARHPFSREKETAGRKQLKLFLRRHPNLSFRKPQRVSAARIHGFTKENVDQFFYILEPEMVNIKFSPNRIFNVDETVITIVKHSSSKVVGLKGKSQVASLSSAERGALVTVVTCMSASGRFIPPLLIFPRKNMESELLNDALPVTIGTCHISGWIQVESFTHRLGYFISVVKPTTDNPIVLVLDGRYSHTRNIDVVEITCRNSVVIFCLPHTQRIKCSHFMWHL
jgi:hypothetical protein